MGDAGTGRFKNRIFRFSSGTEVSVSWNSSIEGWISAIEKNSCAYIGVHGKSRIESIREIRRAMVARVLKRLEEGAK